MNFRKAVTFIGRIVSNGSPPRAYTDRVPYRKSHPQLAAQRLNLMIPQVAAVVHLVGVGKIGYHEHGITRQFRSGDTQLKEALLLLIVQPVEPNVQARAHGYLVSLLRRLVPVKSRQLAIALHIVGKPVGLPVLGSYIGPQQRRRNAF